MTTIDFKNRYFYSQLNNVEKRFYKFMHDCLINNQRKFVYIEEGIEIPDEYSELPIFTYRFDEFMITTKVWDALILDTPEFFFVDAYDFLNIDDNIFLMGKEEDYYTQEEIININNKLEEVYNFFDNINDPFELECAIVDYFSKNYTYDEETPDYYVNPNDSKFDINKWKRYKEKYSIVGLLNYGKAVCSGISLLAQYIFNRKGISVINVEGRPYNAKNETIGHRWLMINIDGDYYHFDATWNIVLANDLRLPQLVVFNIPLEEAIKLYIFDENLYPNIICNNTKYNYYNMMGKYYKSLDGVISLISNLDFNNGYYHFKISNDLDKELVKNTIKDILDFKGYKYRIIVELTYFAITIEN